MLFHLLHAFRGKTLARSLMNRALSDTWVSGKVLDLGGGAHPSYLGYLQKKGGYSRTTIDIDPKVHNRLNVDLEVDTLPFADASFDTILMINILEHIFNHVSVLKESRRVLNPGGALIGFVPFLVEVHRDPHDYFRYTDESLERLLKDTGFYDVHVTPLGFGPFSVGYNTLISVFPNFLFVWLLPIVLAMDAIILRLRSSWNERFPLGYLFTAKK